MDKYKNFKELDSQESEYRIEVLDRASEVTIIAPHGGRIEPHTAEIAALIAGDHYNLFCFHGLKQDDNYDLHITSHKFDHPRALELVCKARYVIAVHGCTVIEPVAYLGGLDTELIEQIGMELTTLGVPAECNSERFCGTHHHNICNRGKLKRGVQLELSRAIRDRETVRNKVGTAVRSALTQIKNRERQGSYLSRKR
ncbi:MAG: poly-gamma-glutamate hydrolase family protein [Desulfofustis sp.]|nr:poly-gamma-glutamate hydrolase family protein [Desulfofustis sp.]NNK13000.1 poly-gamma-glutamate hydrolase family protein [Desulfofustis sp.]